ncbi:MAG: zf-HC2 domain-containing protein [Clostridia bacterium]|nr:zf-HC2 domain-containing protein [Clostridia bacterium]
MKQNKLDCCVVRDLLPSYMEELTEPETSEQIEAHLAECDACSELERNMRTQIPAKPVPKKSLRFLKKNRNTHIISAVLAIIFTLACVFLWYNSHFRYPNTEAGRLDAVQKFVACGKADSEMEQAVGGDIVTIHDDLCYSIQEGTSMHVTSYTESGKDLFVSFTAEDQYHTCGILHLSRGLNGKYYPVSASYGIPDSATIMYQLNSSLPASLDECIVPENVFCFAGFSSKEVASIRIYYTYYDTAAKEIQQIEKTYPIKNGTFLWAFPQSQLATDFGITDFSTKKNPMYIEEYVLLDKDGNDITEQYDIPSQMSVHNQYPIAVFYLFIIILLGVGVIAVAYILKN